MAYIGNSPGTASQRITTTFVATEGQTVFIPSSGYTIGYLDVFHNGIKLIVVEDYTAIDGLSITLLDPCLAGDNVELVAYIPRGLSDGYMKSEADALLAAKANIASPTFTGTPTAPTASVGTNNTQIATTAFVNSVILTKDNTDEITEGSTNLYYTNSRARASLSASDGITYNSSTGAFTLTDTSVTAGTYGSSTQIPTISIDANGRITSASNTSVSIPSGAITVTGGDLTLSGSTGSNITNATLNAVGTAGTYTKITTDTKGRVTSGTTLSSGDIPNLDASKITTGILDAARMSRSVDGGAASSIYIAGQAINGGNVNG